MSAPPPLERSPRARPLRRRAAALALACLGLVGLLALAEVAFRARAERLGFDAARRAAARDYVLHGWTAGYAPHPHTIFRRPPAPGVVNAEGFKDAQWTLARTRGVPRILCLGGSTTESGNDAGLQGSFPFFLGAILRERLGREVEVLNAGMSGWNSAELVAAWFLDLIDFRPDLVVIHEAVNDVEPRGHQGFRRDYSHYRHAFVPLAYDPLTRWLAAHSDLWLWLVGRDGPPTIQDMTVFPDHPPYGFDGVRFPPGTLEPYRRNLRSIGESVLAEGGTLALMTLVYDTRYDARPQEAKDVWPTRQFRVGIREHNQVMRELAAAHGWLLCDLEALERERMDEWAPWFRDLVHVEPEGNRRKAERLAQTLIEQGFFARLDAAAGAGAAAEPDGGAASAAPGPR